MDHEEIAVQVRTSFEGLHCWPEAPEPVAFLRDLHRHVFHVEVNVEVTHADRDVEFFMLKAEIDAYITRAYDLYHEGNPTLRVIEHGSCEMIARGINEYLISEGYTVLATTVREDDENAGVVAP